MDTIKIVLIIVSIKSFITLVLLYKHTYSVCRDIKLKKRTVRASDKYISDNIGRCTSIVGAVKTGKSSFLSAVLHSGVRIIQNELMNRLDSIKNDLYYLDFNKIDEYLNDQYQYTNDYKVVGELLYKDLQVKPYVIHEYTNIKFYENMIYDYAEYYYHLYIKGNYMYTRGISVYDRVNDCPSKYIYDETLEIKNVKNTHMYYFEPASVIGDDEKSVRDSNSKSFDKEAKESGTKEFKIFIGHIMRELGYYFTTKQIEADELVTTRRLNITTYETRRAVEKIYNFSSIQKLCDRLIRFRYFWFKMKFSLVIGRENKARKMDYYYNSTKCKYRKFLSKINNIKNWCDSQGLLIHEGRLFKYSPTTAKLELVDDNVVLPLPYRESRGVYNCYEFACIGDELRKMSNVTNDDIPFTSRFGKAMDSEKTKFLYESSNDKKIDDF